MRKTLFALVVALSALQAKADEGMWTLFNLPQAVYERMVLEGYGRGYGSLYADDDAVMKAVVNFSGYCSGVVVSPDGLVFTNHHCGFEAIRSHSTVEHDYMLNGFYAKSFEEELPNKDMFVSFMLKQECVTDRVVAALGKKLVDLSTEEDKIRLEQLVDSLERAMTDSVKQLDKTLHVDVQQFFSCNEYYATTYQDFTDLRLVFAIPKSIGKFGGETDNWMWPRQTCDFSVFRIYADPETNGPAAYSEKNVPYHPKHWAPISMEGYKEGDFAMTMGYPGSTERYLSSYGIREMRDAENAPRAQVRGVKQQVMWKHMMADEAVRIKYDSKYAQSSNYWKNALGMNKCIDSIGIINLKRDHEARIAQWQKETGFLKDRLDFDKLGKMYEERLEWVKTMTYFRETFMRTNELCDRALRLNNGMEVKGPERKPKKQYVEFADNSDTWDEALDKEVFATLLENYGDKVLAKYLPGCYAVIDNFFHGDYRAYVDHVYKNSMLMKPNQKLYINSKKYKKDPGVQLGLDLLEVMGELRADLAKNALEVEFLESALCEANRVMEMDEPHYSDANFTMRLSYGQVGGFDLGGKPSGYYTEASSIVDKMRRAEKIADYAAEPEMLTLFSSPDFTPYADKETGEMHLCFLTNNDITGGNSGSPMFDGQGRLIGLAFDGNWDSLSSDINFDHRLARCIGVDIRYVLFMMDRWGHADRLIKEITQK